ncbi:putative armadillo-like helical protein [Dioscorea sansibarensis]
MKQSERNTRHIIDAGTSLVLASSFNLFSRIPVENSDSHVLEEIIQVLSFLFPLDKEAVYWLSSSESINSIISILNSGVFAKASLTTIFYLVSSNEEIARKFIDLNLVSTLLEILVDSDKRMCERALAVLDITLSYESGREMARGNALAMPVLVKKIFRVSEMATELVVSAIWKICCCKKSCETEYADGKREKCLIEGLQFGAFQKLLVLLQIGCSEGTKEKVTELLKMLNGHRAQIECIDPMDFKGVDEKEKENFELMLIGRVS